MIKIELGELYGLKDEKELMETINNLRRTGFSEEEIQNILNDSASEERGGRCS